MGQVGDSSPTGFVLVRAFLRLPLVPQSRNPATRRLTLGWALAYAVGTWLGVVISDDLRHGWQLWIVASVAAVLIGLTLASNYWQSQRR